MNSAINEARKSMEYRLSFFSSEIENCFPPLALNVENVLLICTFIVKFFAYSSSHISYTFMYLINNVSNYSIPSENYRFL